MDSYQTQNFDPCIIAAANQQRDIMQSVNSQTQVEQVQSQENHDTLQQQQQQHQQTEQTHQAAQIQSNATQSMNLTPVRLPAILDGEYFVVTRVEDTSVTVRCLQCQRLLNGNLKSTGNFLSHIKVSYDPNMRKIFHPFIRWHACPRSVCIRSWLKKSKASPIKGNPQRSTSIRRPLKNAPKSDD